METWVKSKFAVILLLVFAAFPIAHELSLPTCSCYAQARASNLPGGFELRCQGECEASHPRCDSWVENVVMGGQMGIKEGCACFKQGNQLGWYWCNLQWGGCFGGDICDGYVFTPSNGGASVIVCTAFHGCAQGCVPATADGDPWPAAWTDLCSCGC